MPLTFASSELIALSLESVLYGITVLSPLLSSFLTTHLPRALRLPLCGVRQRSLQQATAKGWRELPPHRGLSNPFRPHNMGSSFLA